MAYWFYYSTDGQKQGALTEEQLKELAANGKITPGTMLEHQSGDTTIARDVKWLTFGETAKPQTLLPQQPIEPTPHIATSTPVHPVYVAEQAKKSFGDKLQDVGNGMQQLGKGIIGAGCSCGCLIVSLIFLFAVISAIFNPQKDKEDEPQKQEQWTNQSEQQATPKIPSYSIISDEEFGIRKNSREVAIRLQKPVSEQELTAIANKIRDSKKKSYERTNTHFYLPGMIPGEGAWATGNFNPDLKVKIFGTSDEILAQAREGTYDLEAEKASQQKEEREKRTTAQREQREQQRIEASQKTQQQENAIFIFSTDLMQAYVDNKVAADINYKGKILVVSGTIDTIGKDILGAPYVTLKTNELIHSTQCFFQRKDEASLVSLQKGQNITALAVEIDIKRGSLEK